MSGENKHTEEPAAAAAAPFTPSARAKSYAFHTRGHPDDRQRPISEEERRRIFEEAERKEKLRKRLRTIEKKKEEEALPGYIRYYYPQLVMFRRKDPYDDDDDEDGRVIVKLISVDGDTRKPAWYKGTIVETPNHIRNERDYKVRMDKLPKGEWEGDNLVFIKSKEGDGRGRWGHSSHWLSKNIIVVDSSRMRKIGKAEFYGREKRFRDKAALNIALASAKRPSEGTSGFPPLKGVGHLDKLIASFGGRRKKTKRRRRKTKRKTKKRRRKTRKKKKKNKKKENKTKKTRKRRK